MPATAPRPYDPVEEAAAAMGVANLRPRYFITGSPDATVGLNARYGQAVQQSSDLGFDLARRPLQLEQERLQVEGSQMAVDMQGVRYDRVQNALKNRDRIEGILAGLSPGTPDYRSKRLELAKLGADEILGEELKIVDQQNEPYDRVRNELDQRDTMERELGPKREVFLKELTTVDPNQPDFRKRTFEVMAKNPWILQDPVAYRALEDYSRTGLEQERARKLRERERLSFDPETRNLYDSLVKDGTDPDNALFAAQRARQTKLLKLQAVELGLGQKELADYGDDPEVLSEKIAARRGQYAQQKRDSTAARGNMSLLTAQLRAARAQEKSEDETKRAAAQVRIDEIMEEMDNLGAGGSDPDADMER